MATDEITPFLKTIALKFVNDEELRANLFRYRFFFQNKRAGKFFHHFIKELTPSNQPIILPEVTTLPTHLRKCQHIPEEDVNNELFLIYHLFNIYQENRKTKTTKEVDNLNDLNSFYNFGKLILTDFNDLDLQLADPNKIFGNLQDLKDLMSDPSEYLSESQISALDYFIKKRSHSKAKLENNFSTFYGDMAKLYDDYKVCLRSYGLAYNGMVLRDTVEAIKEGRINLNKDGKINVFVGLNALTKAEIEILKHFKDSKNSHFYWDYDSTFFNQIILFGKFKEQNLGDFPEPQEGNPLYLPRDNKNHFPDIEVISVPSKMGQTAFIGNELNKKASTPEGHKAMEEMKVAVVLANERLLTSLLSHLDSSSFLNDKATKRNHLVNVTMGYPIKESPIVGSLIRLLQLQRAKYRRGHWRGREVCEILSSNLLANKPHSLHNLIINDKLFWLEDNELRELIQDHCSAESRNELEKIFFVPNEDSDGLLYYVSNIIQLLINREALKSEIEGTETSISNELTILNTIASLLERQKHSLVNFRIKEPENNVFTFDILYDILTNLLSRARIPFSGEPLRGLQIMGILETRGLDFETIYIIDGTDGILPAHTKSMGIIPHLLRCGHHLPTYQWQEQTRAYNFYRLISRAKKVVILYDSRKDYNSKGEPSRYIQQLKYVFNHPNIVSSTANFEILTNKSNINDFQIDHHKVDQFRKKITTTLGDDKKYLSPSRINDYIDCPRKFYFQSILGIKEEEELDELIDDRMLGSLVHDTINRLYEKYIGKSLTTSELESLSDEKINECLNQSIRDLFKNQNIALKGFNKVQIETNTLGLIKKIIALDIELSRYKDLKYLGGEIKISTAYQIAHPDKDDPISVNLKGYIDRIDLLNNEIYRIIDYKTGRDDYKIDLDKEFDLQNKSSLNRAALQLFTYCMMVDRYGAHDADGKCIIPTNTSARLIPLMIKPRGQESAPFIDKSPVEKYSDIAIEFEEKMNDILFRIVEGDTTFNAHPSRKYVCNYCPAKSICPDAKTSDY